MFDDLSLCGERWPTLAPEAGGLRCDRPAGHTGAHECYQPVRALWPNAAEHAAAEADAPRTDAILAALTDDTDPTPAHGIERPGTDRVARLVQMRKEMDDRHDAVARAIAEIEQGTGRLARMNDAAEAFSRSLLAQMAGTTGAALAAAAGLCRYSAVQGSGLITTMTQVCILPAGHDGPHELATL